MFNVICCLFYRNAPIAVNATSGEVYLNTSISAPFHDIYRIHAAARDAGIPTLKTSTILYVCIPHVQHRFKYNYM